MNKRVIKYIQDNRLRLLIGITIAIGISTVLLINSFIFRNKVASEKNFNSTSSNNVISKTEGNNPILNEDDINIGESPIVEDKQSNVKLDTENEEADMSPSLEDSTTGKISDIEDKQSNEPTEIKPSLVEPDIATNKL